MKTILLIGLSLAFCGGSFAQKYTKHLEEDQSQYMEFKGAAAGCWRGETITEISLNNVRTYLQVDGILWTAPDGVPSGYEIPKGSGKNSIYGGGMWIGGTDIYGLLKLASVTYVGGRSYFPGPLIAKGDAQGTTDIEVCYQYDRHFEITRYQVETFRNWYNTPADKRGREFDGYTIPQIILDWPAHGDASAGYDFHLAPFWDNNDDGSYNPADGDYPFYDLDGILPCGTSREERHPHLKGDGTVWWVFNDGGNVHYFGEIIGMEIRAQAFQFSTNDELNDMSFYNFELINRSTSTLIETYFGMYIDGDIGDWKDDFAGCHVTKGIGYFYNGDAIDGDGQEWAYGSNPPAIGFDLFEGPYQDPNGLDDCSSYDEEYNLICNECILNGNINGLNFSDGIVDNERWGMSRLICYVFRGAVGYDPLSSAVARYNALRGMWPDGRQIRYYGKGYPSSLGTGPITDFMFPGDSDPCGWGQGGVPMPEWTDENAGNSPADRRIIQSSGPFIMEPGAINDITIGVIWARSYDGGLLASVDKMLLADEKAQRLFDNCFKVIDGPDAPELTIIEQDQKLIFHIWNKPNSNNHLEAYIERDPSIICPATDPECDVFYSFQGYQLWQLKDHTVSVDDASRQDESKARLIFQCDIRDGIGQIINFEWNQQMQASVPRIEVEGADLGIRHSFVVEKDLFSADENPLINFKDYYYVAIAYAHNNFKQYDQSNPDRLEGQKLPYKAGRRGAGGPIKVYKATPHKIIVDVGGTLVQSDYGDSPIITQVEGHGNGINILDIDTSTHDAIMAGPPWKTDEIIYKAGRGPISVKVVDPMSVFPDTYTLKFDSTESFVGSYMNGKVVTSNWYIFNSTHDTVFSEATTSRNYDQLILKWGLSINITQQEIPFKPGALNNGFLEASIEFEDPSKPWLWFVPDDDRSGPRNWIRAGYASGDYSGDLNAVYEKVLGGTWAPFKQAYIGTNGVSNSSARAGIDTKRQRLANVDLYITTDRSKWTRSPVVETTDDEALSIGNAQKFELRTAQSVDQYGHSAEMGSGIDSFNMEAVNYLSETGLGWFPGYAIDVETGERLNIVYGESSWLTGDNGADMMWNPSPREGSKLYMNSSGLSHEGVYFGGKHFIYIMGHNATKTIRDTYYFPAYDGGQFFLEKINDTKNRYRIRELFVNAMWCAIPILDSTYFNSDDVKDDPYGFIKSDIKLRFRVVGQYCVDVMEYAIPDSLTQNNNKPMYTISTAKIATLHNQNDIADNSLDLIRVVPNPYYGYSAYESGQSGSLVKVTNLPKTCTVSIFSLNGNLVRRITKDSDQSYINWNIKNQYGKPVASGVYIFHIDAPGIGEKILKWFGI